MRIVLVNLSLLACLLWLSGFVAPSNAAPVPKPKPAPKTTAEKLVGKWRLVRFSNGHPVSPELDSTTEFTKDGKVFLQSTDPKHGHREESGTYTITGNTIHFSFKARPNPQDRHCIVAIKELTRDKLVFSDPYSHPDQGHEHRRIKAGKGK